MSNSFTLEETGRVKSIQAKGGENEWQHHIVSFSVFIQKNVDGKSCLAPGLEADEAFHSVSKP